MLLPSGSRVFGAALAVLWVASPLDVAGQGRPVVAIDAGHGGAQAGVQHEGILEKDLVLQIAFVLGSEFVKAGYDVVFTRTRDEAVEWDDRRRVAEDAGAAALLMLHANGDEDTTRHGAEVYAYLADPGSAQLAEEVAGALRASGAAAVVEGREWGFLASDAVPTAMIELAFLTNPVERRLLLRSEFQHDLGRSLVSAVEALRAGG